MFLCVYFQTIQRSCADDNEVDNTRECVVVRGLLHAEHPHLHPDQMRDASNDNEKTGSSRSARDKHTRAT